MTVRIPATANVAIAKSESRVPAGVAQQTIPATAARMSWIHDPAAVTHSRARRSGKLQASFTLQKKARSK